MRTINAPKIKELIKAQGELGTERTATGSEISSSTLQKLMNGKYGRVPRRGIRTRLCQYLGVSEDDLFPPADTGSDKAS